MSDGSFGSSKIKDLILGHMSGPSPTCEERQIASTEEWGLLKTTAATWKGWDHTAHKVPPPEYWKNSRIEVKAGDVLVTKAGPRHRVGVVVYVDKTPPHLMVSGKMIGLRPDPVKVDFRVLAAALSQQEPQVFLDSRTTGMADSQLNFTNELLLNTVVKLPPRLEQNKIAQILATVDLAIEQTEALIAKQQRIKTGLMQDLLTRGIDEHGNLRSEQTHVFKNSVLGRIPMEWEVKTLAGIIEIIDCKHYTPTYVEEGIPVIRPRNIKDSGFDLSDLDYVTADDYALLTDKHEPKDGDIVFSRNASFGVPVYVDGMGPFCIGQDVVIMTKKSADTRFTFFALKSEKVVSQIMNASGGSTFGRIDLGAIRALKVALPESKVEQFDIAGILSKCDSLVVTAGAELQKLRSLKAALMQDLLTGNTRVTPLLEMELTH